MSFMLSVNYADANMPIMLGVIILNVFMLSVVMLNGVMLSVVVPFDASVTKNCGV